MANPVVMGSPLMCSFGMAPSSLMVTPQNKTMMGQVPAANVMDFKPMANIMPFGMCMSLSNPTVAAATAAALGVLTPMPCIPVTTPWMPGAPTVLVANMPLLNTTSKCMCSWGGQISIVASPAATINVP